MITELPTISKEELVFLSREQFIELEKRMISSYHFHKLQIIENAGRNLAELARKLLYEQAYPDGKLLVFAGIERNGGSTLCAARRLYLWGYRCEVYSPVPEDAFRGDPARQLRILKRIGVPLHFGAVNPDELRAELIIDGLAGYRLKQAPEGNTASLIRWINDFPANILSLDIPSGLDADEGLLYNPFAKAYATLTLAMPKLAFLKDEVRNYTGRIYLGDISVPWKLFSDMKIPLPKAGIFNGSSILQLRFEG